MHDMSQVYRYHFPVFASYTFCPIGRDDGELCDFRIMLQRINPMHLDIDVTHMVPDDLYTMIYDRELALQLEAHAEESRVMNEASTA